MKIEFYPSGIYKVVKISDLMTVSNLDELRFLIDNYIKFNETHIALYFTDCYHMYSDAVGMLVTCLKKLKDVHGDMCVLNPKPEIKELFVQMGLNLIMPLYYSEKELPQS